MNDLLGLCLVGRRGLERRPDSKNRLVFLSVSAVNRDESAESGFWLIEDAENDRAENASRFASICGFLRSRRHGGDLDTDSRGNPFHGNKIYNRIHLAQLLWKIDRDTVAVLLAIVDDLLSKDAHLNYGYNTEWLVEVDPSGDTIVPALAKYVATQEYPAPTMEAFTLYGSRARSALPAIRLALSKEKLYVPWYENFLFSASPLEFFFNTLTGRVLLVLMACVGCLMVETFWFRWRLFRRGEVGNRFSRAKGEQFASLVH